MKDGKTDDAIFGGPMAAMMEELKAQTSALYLAEWLAKTYGPKGITVSCFCPGPMLTPMLLSNDFPPDHPVLTVAATPDEVADRLVHAIDDERFLILDSALGLESLAAKASDYEKWIAGD